MVGHPGFSVQMNSMSALILFSLRQWYWFISGIKALSVVMGKGRNTFSLPLMKFSM
jgi:hypothetical protein